VGSSDLSILYSSHKPPVSLKVLMPLSAEIPAPVKTTSFFFIVSKFDFYKNKKTLHI
jgi:hypothetical protein